MSTLTYVGTLVTRTCWCGIRHAIPSELSKQADENGHGVYCPLGHEWVVRETEAARLSRELEATRKQARSRLELLQAEERSHAATRGHLTRVKKRASAGVCPCCNRTFQQLARHMKTKHPDYPLEAEAKAETA